MDKVKVAVVGSRTFDDYATLVFILNKIKKDNDYEYEAVVSGGAHGADTFAEQYADTNKIKKIVFPADWKKFGKRAGFLRNVDIIDNCDICVCFWDGESHGTKHDIELCQEKHKKCYIYNYLTQNLSVEENEKESKGLF